ncbi:translocase of chloroplast 159, chloroplastic, partial [Tanacetum coccineum]
MLVLTREPVFGVFVYFGVMGKSGDVAPLLHDGTSTTAQLYPVLLALLVQLRISIKVKDSLNIELSIIENYLRNLDDVQNWIRLVVSNTCLKHLSLDIRVLLEDDDDPHLSLALPNELFSSQALHTIHLTAATSEAVTNLRLRISSTNLINCLSLRVLDLECIFINQDVLNNLLSTCKLLEKIKLAWCAGLKNVKVQNLLRLTELDILSTEDDDLWEINNVPCLSSFRYRHIFASRK